MNEFERRERAIELLMTQSQSRLEAFFFSLGLAAEFLGPAVGWGRQKRIVSALFAAEERGDLSSVLDLIERTFGKALPISQEPLDVPFADQGSAAETFVAERRPSADPVRTGSKTIADSVTSVFIVHGHDLSLREKVARLVERVGDGQLEAVVLAEQVNAGQTIIEKFETYASVAGYAIVLLTPDDFGGIPDGTTTGLRARQNVILELGYFIGVLGRNRIAVLARDEIEIPSDIHGVVYIRADDEGAWKHNLCREMRAAGLPVNFSKIV